MQKAKLEAYTFFPDKREFKKTLSFKDMKIYIDEKKCTGCGACRAACPKGPRIYSLEKKGGRTVAIVKDPSWCLGCRLCLSVCMEDALTLKD
ncbi:MAG: 4Fe-4S binding protein [Methanosarcinaceae archaeon]|nr:4Fe-4S binding protein [Methanosarcinaceae archaeon]